VLGVLALVSWDTFFRGFHSLFFSAGTWEFYLDDSLIRLFPQTFWMDAGITAGLVILLGSGLLIGLSFIGHGRRKKARAAVKALTTPWAASASERMTISRSTDPQTTT
ncbi:lipoprotein intramolecular transacylase Lit, partial [Brevibacterium paucivorans]